MQVEKRHGPAFAALFVTLLPGERLVAEADAMASMSTSARMGTRFSGGLLRALLRRLLGGESVFVNEFSCAPGATSAQVVLTQPTPGDIVEVTLQDTALFLQPGAFVACEPGVQLGVGWAGLTSFFNGEGLFRLKVHGRGRVWIGAYGGVSSREVNGSYIVDTGHLVAYEPTVSLRMALAGGLFSSIFGGEGLVSRVEGRGRIYVQSRSLAGLAAWTNQHLW